jgi:hypothetical protein
VQRAPNGIGHPFPLQKHVRVPESQHFESLIAQPGVAARVVLLVARLVVLAAIEFDDDSPIDPSESPKTERNAKEEPLHEITLATPLHLLVQVGSPRVEIHLVMGAAAHAIADPRK